MTDNILNDPTVLDSYFRPTWCPGCGNFSIWLSLKTALVSLSIPHEDIVLVFDVGCSSNSADFWKVYGFHGLHGRAIPPAVGIKCANSDLKVIVIIGDGGGYGEGLTHYLNEMRGNHDITVLVHDNHRYSLTTGQMSPTTAKGTKTRSTPFGSIERELNPMALALSNHASFVAREFAVDTKNLTNTIKTAIMHPGFAVVDILQPCMVFNPEMDTRWYMERLVKLAELNHNPEDKESAWKQAMRQDKLPVGIFWQDKASIPYHQEDLTLKNGPLIKHSLQNIDISNLLEQFK
jgi:2-oxoglutarate/2-oxoacid ferredoxin oxidoreductase subunit beta